MKEMICIVCPRGCALTVDEDNNYEVRGNACPRGATYGQKELIAPMRSLSSTVRVQGSSLAVAPVKSKSELPKGLILEAMQVLNTISLRAPLKRGAVVCSNILGTGVDVIVTRDIEAV